MNFQQLKKDGYYLRVQKGTFKNQKHTEFSVVKNLSENGDSKKIACIVNLASYRILKNEWGFKSIEDEDETNWLQQPESYNFETQTKQPLKIVWNS